MIQTVVLSSRILQHMYNDNMGTIDILLKPGFILNPNDEVVNAIFLCFAKTGGHCPCANPDKGTEFDMCPCREYRENNKCCCQLYIRDPKSK